MFSHDNVIHLFMSSLKRSENANFDTFKVNGYTFRESNSASFILPPFPVGSALGEKNLHL